MVNSRNTKRALITSLLSLVICISMLIGTTYAWFTDSVTSSGNKIVSGNLDVDLYLWTDADTAIEITDESDPIFGAGALAQNNNAATLWEPGKTQVAYLSIKNNGSLDLKYMVNVNVDDANSVLYEVMQYDIVPDARFGDVTAWADGDYVEEGINGTEASDVALKAGEEHFFALAIHMDEEAGNKYMNGEVNFDVNVLATQLASEEDSFGNQYDAAAKIDFADGKGTKEDPYIVNEPSQLMSISDYYNEYTYFKVADGVKTLDLTGMGRIKLNGSFDGNGVEIVGLSTSLFQSVGDIETPQEIKISNMDVTVNTNDGHALVRNIYNPGETIFENVELHGYIEGQYNVGSFYNYGTANTGNGDGTNYTVTFINTTSDATLVCTTGNVIGGMLGHGYQGSGHVLSVNMDANSGYSGEMYTNASVCYKVIGMCSTQTYVLNGVEISRYTDVYPHNSIDVVAPVAGADGYYVAPVSGADSYVVYLNSQLTAYDENDVKIDNKAGMTWNLGKDTIAATNGKIFDSITDAEIINNANDEMGYKLNNGTLKIYSGRNDNYASGWVTLQVNQYAADGTLLATGIATVYTFPEL